MSQYSPKPFRSFRRNIKVKVDLSIYATKDIKNISHVDTSRFSLKANLASLKTEVDKLNIGKLTTVPVDLSKLSIVVTDDVVKKAVCDKLAAKVNNIDTSDFVLKTKFQTGKTELEKKIPDVTGFVQKTKLTELEDKIPDVSSLASKTALSAVENKIPSVSSLVKKTDHDIKLVKFKRNFLIIIMTSTLLLQSLILASVFNARLAQANLITKPDFDVKLSSLNRKITSNKTKHLLVENELIKLKTFDLSYFIAP